MDNCVGVVAAAVAAYRRRKKRIKNIGQFALLLGFCSMTKMQSCFSTTGEHSCRLCNASYSYYLFMPSVQIRCCWGPLAQQRSLHGALRASSCIRVVVQAPHDRRPRLGPCHDRTQVCGDRTTSSSSPSLCVVSGSKILKIDGVYIEQALRYSTTL